MPPSYSKARMILILRRTHPQADTTSLPIEGYFRYVLKTSLEFDAHGEVQHHPRTPLQPPLFVHAHGEVASPLTAFMNHSGGENPSASFVSVPCGRFAYANHSSVFAGRLCVTRARFRR